MIYIKKYEELYTEYNQYSIGDYIIWSNDDDVWEICEIVDIFKFNTLRVKDLYYLEDDKLELNGGSQANIDLSSPEERNDIKYVSNNLKDCKEIIILLKTSNKYNL